MKIKFRFVNARRIFSQKSFAWLLMNHVLLLEVVHAQELFPDSSHMLPAFVVSGERMKELGTGLKVTSIDSLQLDIYRERKMGDLVSGLTGIYVKNYGSGNLATISMRGASAGQTGVFWNGFDIKSRTLGMSDLSLIPAVFFDKVEIQYGGSGSLYGSGNIGGGIHFSDIPSLTSGGNINAGFGLGSFGEAYGLAKAEYGNGRFSGSTSLFSQQSDNDFLYEYQGNTLRQPVSRSHGSGIYQTLSMKSGMNHLSLALWAQRDKRDLPPPEGTSGLNERKKDDALRVSARWNRATATQAWSAGVAWINDDLRYTMAPGDTMVIIDSRIHNQVLNGNVRALFHMSGFADFSIGAGGEHVESELGDNAGNATNLEAYLVASLAVRNRDGKLAATLNTRQEIAEDYHIPFCPSLGIEWNTQKTGKFRMNLSRNFRVPTLNDRFWQPGGNPDLRPEQSLNAECGWSATIWTYDKRMQLTFSLSAFLSEITDYILWIPQQASLWMPMNIQRVRTEGMEPEIQLKRKMGSYILMFTGSYGYVSARNKEKTGPLDESVNKQLIYTPEHRFNASICVTGKSWKICSNLNYTGKTYTSRDNSTAIGQYMLGNLYVNFLLIRKPACDVNARIECLNMSNESYTVVESYPMPGRSFRLGLNVNLKYNGKCLKPK